MNDFLNHFIVYTRYIIISKLFFSQIPKNINIQVHKQATVISN